MLTLNACHRMHRYQPTAVAVMIISLVRREYFEDAMSPTGWARLPYVAQDIFRFTLV